jgi:hypothetical protein
LCVLVGQFFVLGKFSFVTAQKPFADSHVRLRLALCRRERIVMQRQCGVELTAHAAKFIGGSHLELGFCKSEVGGFLDVLTRPFLIIGQEDLWDIYLGQLSRLEHAQHVGTLRRILISSSRSLSDELEATRKVLWLSMLAEESHHAEAVIRGRVALFCAGLVVLQRLDGIVGLLKLHAHSIFGSCITFRCRARVASERFLLVGAHSKLAEL